MTGSNIIEETYNQPKIGDYSYGAMIKSPKEINVDDFCGNNFNLISNNGLHVLADDITALFDYVEILVSGRSNASRTDNPLGDRYFLKTAAKCTDPCGQLQTRYIYVNNVANGNIPFLSAVAGGTDFTQLEGLVPGILTDLNAFNPISIFGAMLNNSSSPCQKVSLEETNDNGQNTFQYSHYVLNSDIKQISACRFNDGINPVTNNICRGEGFSNLNPLSSNNNQNNMGNNNQNNMGNKNYNFEDINKNLVKLQNDDFLIRIYFILLTILYLYIFLRVILKNSK